MASELTTDLMRELRVKSSVAESEIMGLVEACKQELAIAGVYVTDEREPLSRQAIRLYCKAHYGYDKDTERFRAAYAALRDAMALSGDYAEASDG